jgi:hypothetical protein
MEQTLITKIAMVILAMVVITLLMGFYSQFEKLLVKDAENQKIRDDAIQKVFDMAHTKLIIVVIKDSGMLR